MRLALSSLLLGLCWFAVVNVASTMVAAVLTRAIGSWRCSAGLLLGVRLMPAALSTFFVAAVFLPAHWRFEPPNADESFGVALALLAALSLLLIGRSALRAVRMLRIDMQLAAATSRLATPRGIAFEVADLPGVSLAGIFRPKILVGSTALATLTPAELDVAVAHEIAHQHSRDNFKRFLICCAPDVFGWSPEARSLELRWEAETECQADARAVRGDDSRAVSLASALVKVARLTRPGSLAPSPAWSGFHVPTLLETRVRRLVDGDAKAPRTRAVGWSVLAAVALSLPASAWVYGFSSRLHDVTEMMVAYLP